jgi:cell division protein FtsB
MTVPPGQTPLPSSQQDSPRQDSRQRQDSQPKPQPGPRAERPRLTSRAAVLAVVLCAIALSLAYPVREFIAQRRQIDQLEAEHQAVAAQLRRLEAQHRQLSNPSYVEQLARDRLHMCMPTQTCYVIIGPPARRRVTAASAPGTPWYQRLWSSVEQADKATGR